MLPQGFGEYPGALSRVVGRNRGLQQAVRYCLAFVVRRLRIHPLNSLLMRQATIAHQSGDSLFSRGVYDDYGVKLIDPARLDQQWDRVNEGGVGVFPAVLRELLSREPVDLRVHDGVEPLTSPRIFENQGSEGFAVESAVGAEYRGSKGGNDGFKAWRTGLDGLSREDIRVDHPHALCR